MSTVSQLPASAKEAYREARRLRMDMSSSDGAITFQVDDADLESFLTVVGGTVELIGGIGGVVLRVVPLQHPRWKWMYAKSIEDVEYGWDSVKKVRYHKITVGFGNLPYAIDGNMAFITYNSRPDVRTMTAPRGGVLIGGAEPTADRSLVVNGTSMSLTIHQMPFDALNEAVWNSANGSVNSTVFRGIQPGYVKYLGPTLSDSVTFNGTRTYEVTHEFSASPILWNQEFNDSGSLANMTVGGSPGYASIDFWTVLFGS